MKALCQATCLLLLFAPQGRAEEAARPRKVPFELLRSKHIAVKIKVNGKGPYRVIFDTGAPITLLNNKVARESGMIARDAKPGFFNLFGSMGPAKIKSLELGELKVENSSAVVMDHPTVELISKVLGPIEGIVGFPFFARYKMTLDYQAQELTFVPNGYDPPDAIQALLASVMALADDKLPQPRFLAPAAQWGLVVEKKKGDEEAGVTIKQVLAGGAAAQAGLQAKDRLLTLDGRWTDTVPDAYLAASFVKPGMPAAVRIRRDGKEMERTVKPRAGL